MDNSNNIVEFPRSNQVLADKQKNRPYPQEEEDAGIYEDTKCTSIREEIHEYTIRIMNGYNMLGYNPCFENFETAKLNAETSICPRDAIETTIAAIDRVNKKIHIVIGDHEKLFINPLFKTQFGDFEIE
jgi:hypothetical protein